MPLTQQSYHKKLHIQNLVNDEHYFFYKTGHNFKIAQKILRIK